VLFLTQALWSQAREQANVVTIICANSSYQILKVCATPCSRRLPQQLGPSNPLPACLLAATGGVNLVSSARTKQ